MLALLRFAENPRDRVAGFRVLQLLPGIGPASAGKVRRWPPIAKTLRHALPEAARPAQARRAGTAFPTLVEDALGRERLAHRDRRARLWYEPSREHPRRCECACWTFSSSSRSPPAIPRRERFLTELTLDPPDATSTRPVCRCSTRII
jgi:DNA helicase-2/ATP-dependent DNA helicase PcrA